MPGVSLTAWGVSHTTLEDVFLRLAKEEEALRRQLAVRGAHRSQYRRRRNRRGALDVVVEARQRRTVATQQVEGGGAAKVLELQHRPRRHRAESVHHLVQQRVERSAAQAPLGVYVEGGRIRSGFSVSDSTGVRAGI